MKRFIKTALTVVLAAAAVSCVKEIEPQKENINGTIDLTITGAINGYTPQEETKAEAQTVVRIMWKGDETVYVFDGTECLGSLTASIEGTDGTYAKLSGTISATQATTLTFVYSPQFSETPDVTEGGKISLDLSVQDDEEVPFLIYATMPTAQAPASFTNEVVQFNLATSVFKCNCAGLGEDGEISKAAINGVNTKCELTLSDSGAPEVSGTTPGTITRTAGFTQADQRAIFSVALPKTDESAQDRTIEVTKGVRIFTASYPKNAFDVSKSFNSVFALEAVPYSAIPFTITSTGSTTVAIKQNKNPESILLEYKKGSSDWTAYYIGSEIELADGESLQFRAGEGGNATFSKDDRNYYSIFVSGDGTISASGNIMSLLDSSLGETNLEKFMFNSLFLECSKLTDASNLVFPATNLAEGCYSMMFAACTSLTTAPALPATNLAEGCYSMMFAVCTSLTAAPALPATELAEGCYQQMFWRCSGLTSAPALPATTLAESCYQQMFEECTNLTTVPILPATTLAANCYVGMFANSGLTIAPTLPATILADNCYASMFLSTNLTAAPTLPATELADNCYFQMFKKCTSLTVFPTLPATTLTESCYESMFEDCTGLTTAPALPATTLAEHCYDSMFSGCTGLNTAPALPATNLAKYCYNQMFYECSALTTAPSLPATTLADDCYYGMFAYSGLTSAPDLPATTLAEYCYQDMFNTCTNLATAPEILPATNLEMRCYCQMFSGCTSLTHAPVLPATTLKDSCYDQMFANCSKLNYVKALFTNAPSSDYMNCWLMSVASEGKFVSSTDATWQETIERGSNTIPIGWTIEKESSSSPETE